MVTVNPSLQRFPMGQDRESGYHGSLLYNYYIIIIIMWWWMGLWQLQIWVLQELQWIKIYVR